MLSWLYFFTISLRLPPAVFDRSASSYTTAGQGVVGKGCLTADIELRLCAD